MSESEFCESWLIIGLISNLILIEVSDQWCDLFFFASTKFFWNQAWHEEVSNEKFPTLFEWSRRQGNVENAALIFYFSNVYILQPLPKLQKL